MPLQPQLKRLGAIRYLLLQQDPTATVECLGPPESALVRKIYRNRGVRWLQSFGRRSRAHREFYNLRTIAHCGVRCTEAVGWSEQRHYGCVDQSELVTRYLTESQNLQQVLAGLDRRNASQLRRQLARSFGRLLASLHRNGLLWGAPMPRNVLVQGPAELAQLAVCDTAATVLLRGDLHGRGLALLDLYDAAFSPSRCRDWSPLERAHLLRSYSDGNRELWRHLWRQLKQRRQWQHDSIRALTMLLYGYLIPRRPASQDYS